ncbi:MAG: ribulose-phosphate 3-epimerase [Candidatus Peregrinibacteria bacterium]
MAAPTVLITPSILSADFAHLQEEVDSIEHHADWIQLDVMDGHFVPNVSFGAPVARCLRTNLPLDAHLMVSNPGERIAEFLKLRVKNITFHAEALTGTEARKSLIKAIRKGGAIAGIAINPGTPLAEVDDVLPEIDLLLVMSVEPGFSGQAFMPEVLEKVREARKRFPRLMIQMDGGIDDLTAKRCRQAGANNLVAGKFIFSASDRAKAIASLRK